MLAIASLAQSPSSREEEVKKSVSFGALRAHSEAAAVVAAPATKTYFRLCTQLLLLHDISYDCDWTRKKPVWRKRRQISERGGAWKKKTEEGDITRRDVCWIGKKTRNVRVGKTQPTFCYIAVFLNFCKVDPKTVFYWVQGILGCQPLWGQIFRLPEQPCWFHALIALQLHSPLPRRYYPTENWLSSRCLTSVIGRELVFPSLHDD